MSCDNYPSKKDVEDFALNAKVINEFTTSDAALTPGAASDGKNKITLAEIWRQANEKSITEAFLYEHTWSPWRSGADASAGNAYRYKWPSGHATFLKSDSNAIMSDPPNFAEFSLASQFISVKDFGAVGDGVTDDTDAIQSAVNYCESLRVDRFSSGCTIHFPSGRYKITKTLTVKKSSIAIVGDGISATVLYAPSASFDILHFDGTTESLYHCSVRNLRIDTPQNTTTGAHVNLKNVINMQISNIMSSGSFVGLIVDGGGRLLCNSIIITQENRTAGRASYAIDFKSASDAHFSDLQIAPSPAFRGYYAVSVRNVDGVYFCNTHMHGGVVVHPNDTGVETVCASVYFVNTYFDTADAECVLFMGSASTAYRNFNFTNCYFRDAILGCVIGTNSLLERVIFNGCQFVTMDRSGLKCTNNNIRELIISDCIFENNNLTDQNEEADLIVGGNASVVSGISFTGGSTQGSSLHVISGATSTLLNTLNLANSTAKNRVKNEGSGTSFGEMIGFTVNNRGSVVINDGDNSAIVEHGLDVTPSADSIQLTARSVIEDGILFVSDVTETTFVIRTRSTIGVRYISWLIDMR